MESSSRAKKVSAWLAELAQRQDPFGKAFLNPEQLDFVRAVAAPVIEEENPGEAKNLCRRSPTEPLRRALHGGPGMGKSHVLRLNCLAASCNGSKVVALQAVMADQLDGDAIHRAVGLNKRGEEAGVGFKRLAELTAAGDVCCWTSCVW